MRLLRLPDHCLTHQCLPNQVFPSDATYDQAADRDSAIQRRGDQEDSAKAGNCASVLYCDELVLRVGIFWERALRSQAAYPLYRDSRGKSFRMSTLFAIQVQIDLH